GTQLHGSGDQIFQPIRNGAQHGVVVGVVVEQENDRDHDGKLNEPRIREAADRRRQQPDRTHDGSRKRSQYRQAASHGRRAGGLYGPLPKVIKPPRVPPIMKYVRLAWGPAPLVPPRGRDSFWSSGAAKSARRFWRPNAADDISMNDANERFGRNPDRRRFLRRAAGVAALAAVGATARRAAADPALDALMGDGQHGEFGQSFDQSSRTIRMPKATAPTLSPQTADFTEQAVKTYDGIVARGGWPQVPKIDELHLGMRHPSVVDLRHRLAVSGDL